MGTEEVMRTVHHLGGNRLKSMVEKKILKIRVSESEKADFLALLEVEVFKAPKDPSFLTDWNSAHGTELSVREGKLVLKRHLLFKKHLQAEVADFLEDLYYILRYIVLEARTNGVKGD
ncbi:hypothetical protein [Thermus tengchongensis]|uniref:hypothetical protein n=1 Tax=Thermus tengchongensis TaxID=1214928 RepID=UPI001F33A407|nr:hypothetical protein [Thermus tengchongensis]